MAGRDVHDRLAGNIVASWFRMYPYNQQQRPLSLRLRHTKPVIRRDVYSSRDYFGISVRKLIVVPLMNMEIGNRKA